MEIVTLANGLWLTHHCPPCKGQQHLPRKGHRYLPHKGQVLKLTTVQFVNVLFISLFILASLPTVTFGVLFVDGHRHEWDLVALHSFCQHGELSLASCFYTTIVLECKCPEENTIFVLVLFLCSASQNGLPFCLCGVGWFNEFISFIRCWFIRSIYMVLVRSFNVLGFVPHFVYEC